MIFSKIMMDDTEDYDTNITILLFTTNTMLHPITYTLILNDFICRSPEGQIVTPFAQILASLKEVTFTITLEIFTNIPPDTYCHPLTLNL